MTSLSPRTNRDLLVSWCEDNEYELVIVETESHTGAPIYHTDVFMFVGTDVIGVCYEVIKPEYRDFMNEKVSKYHAVLEISKEQILDFCGNALEAKDKEGNLHTPTPDSFLDGITRRTVIEIAKTKNIKVIERKIETTELANFVGCFLTGTAAEVTPVSQISEYNFKVCDLIKDLNEAYQSLVRKKTAA